ncbi:addiction module antidote protein, HigA family [bacterium]|nr:MAG: addiction module antidote protein, HigA family [bacterium]
MRKRKIKPIHPGEVLREEFLKPLNITQYRLAKDIAVPPIRISEIVREKRAISTNTALRLAKYFSNSPQFWLNLQSHYELETQKEELANVLQKEVKVFIIPQSRISQKSPSPTFVR